MTRLDRAACYIVDGDVTASAQEIAGTLLGLDDEQRRGIIDGRARDVIGGMSAKQRQLPVVRELHDLVRPNPTGRPAVIAVRPATAADVDQLLKLTEEMDRFYGATAFDDLELRRRKLLEALFGDTPAAKALLAVDQETALGFAAYSFLWPAVTTDISLGW
jgi:hypothetical protein